MKTVAQYVAERFAKLGIKHVFGVPGDYAFPIDNALEKTMSWIGCANELNAAYAADGYARVHGTALLCTTYGVGELSALNAMMGAYAERVPIFHLVGIPGERMRHSHQGLHHSLGDREFYRFFEISEKAACVSALLTPENVVEEMERVIHTALLERRPAYLALPADYAVMEVVGKKIKISKQSFLPQSQPRELVAASKQIVQRLAGAKNPIILPAFTIARYGLQKGFEQLLKLSGISYATMLMDKAVISESHTNYLGMYRGSGSEASVKEAVESADLILNVGGALFTDLATGFFSHKINSEKVITLWPDFVEVGVPLVNDVSVKTYGPVSLQDVLMALCNAFQKGQLQKRNRKKELLPKIPQTTKKVGKPKDQVTHQSFYDRIAAFLQPRDQVVVESGFCMLEMARLKLPAGARFYHQSLWGSIGWATPATLGVSLAKSSDPHSKGRVLLVTGDGSHQFTANELGTMGECAVKPIIFIMNDGVYAIEEFLDQNKRHLYNKLAPWSYAQLPKVMGCHDWLAMQIKTNAELDRALKKAAQCKSACYFEILLSPNLRPAAPEVMTKAFYQNFPTL